MSLHLNKNKSPKLLPNKLSCKGITTYLKEINEIAEKEKPISNDFVMKKQFVSSSDPTNLKNILNALKNSSKRHYIYQDQNQSKDICDLKYIGDLSHVALLDQRNSFQEQDDSDEETQEFNQCIQSKNNLNRSFRLDEELYESSSNEDESLTSNNFFNLELLMTKLQLDQERHANAHIRSKMRKEKYINNLLSLRKNVLLQLHNEQHIDKELRKKNEQRLVEFENAANREILAIEESYMEGMEQRREKILEKIEAVNIAAAAEDEERIVVLSQNLKDHLELLKQELYVVQKDAEKFAGSEIYIIIFEQLPSVISATEKSILSMDFKTASDEEVDSKIKKISEAFSIIESLKKLIVTQEYEKKKESNEQEYEKPKEGNEQKSLLNQDTGTPASQPTQCSTPSNVGIAVKRYYDLKKKFEAVSKQAHYLRENVQLRPLLARTIGIVNQLNNSKHDSSNRGKLQQLINLINGRNCIFGDIIVSTKNNPAADAFVREQLATKLVSLSHDIQVSTMAVYASLIVRLWKLYPDLGELILFKLFDTCPFMVPMTVKKRENQTEEEYNRALGFKHKDGGSRESIDKYLTRMGSAAQLYGRIIAMDTDEHPHGIEHGWKWIARTLNNEPYPSITASLLNGFLLIAGNALSTRYKNQFKKLLYFLLNNYLPLMEKDTLEGGQSDMVSLKSLLQDYFKSGNISKPEEGYKLLL